MSKKVAPQNYLHFYKTLTYPDHFADYSSTDYHGHYIAFITTDTGHHFNVQIVDSSLGTGHKYCHQEWGIPSQVGMG